MSSAKATGGAGVVAETKSAESRIQNKSGQANIEGV
jgi:hypothetical protein